MWNNEWWYKNKWRSWVKLTDEDFELSMSILKKEFDENWLHSLGESIMKHPIFNKANYGEGVPQLSYLLRIASYINDLKEFDGFNNVLKAYKTIQHCKSAELELFMAHILIKSNYEVSFIVPKPKKGMTPDILAKCESGEFVVECKFLDDANGEHWFQNYNMHLSMNIMREVPEGKALIYIPENRYLNIWDYGYPDNLSSSNVAAYIDSFDVVNHIAKLKYSFNKNVYIDVPNKGSIYWMDETDEIRTQILTPELSHRFLNKRLVLNGVNKANLQIKKFNKPGVAAIFQSDPVHEIDLKKTLHQLFEGNKELYSKLMGVLVFPAQNILKYIEPILVENPYSDIKLDRFNIRKSLFPALRYRE